MMSDFWSLRTLYVVGAVASILTFLWTVSAVGLPFSRIPQVDSSSNSLSQTTAPVEWTGNLSSDVQKALIRLGKLDGEPGDIRRRDVREAIEQAERGFGLAADGVPDESLLKQLKSRLETTRIADNMGHDENNRFASSLFSWTFDHWIKIGQVLSSICSVILTWLGLVKSSRKPDEATG